MQKKPFALPARQVHLDFHTSEHIAGVGKRFNKQQFQKALRLGAVNSITVFAKCHHGWCYYPTTVGRQHPELKFDLLGAQIQACHEIGVRAPIYITVGWSVQDSVRHPEWRVLNKDGSVANFSVDPKAKPTDRRPIVSWEFVCPSGAYRQHILDLTAELADRYPVDGVFYDICMYNYPVCHCPNCREGMRTAGINAEDDAQAAAYTVQKWASLGQAVRDLVKRRHPDATVFFNGQCNNDSPPEILDYQTHFELEDLPTFWGGYDKFPLRAKRFARLGKPFMAMSGKFHTMWGEFGGFKHPDAIRFEAASMIAFGARCSFGDQLHPAGEMDLATYRNIGDAYRYVRRIEGLGLDGHPCSNLGLVISGAGNHDQGTANMLLERQIDFEVADLDEDLSRYDTLILPGGRFLDTTRAGTLNRFVASGGNRLVLGESALAKDSDTLLLDMGVKYLGPAAFDVDYLRADRPLNKGLVEAPFLCYTAAPRYKATRATVLADVFEPYFSRTYARYCSHQNTPYQLKPAAHLGASRFGRVLFFPHALGALYHDYGARLHRDLFINGLRQIYRSPVLGSVMPSAGRVNLVHQPEKRRYVVHLLYGTPLTRGKCQVIEDLVPLFDIPLSLRVPEQIRRVSLPLEGKTLRATRKTGALHVKVPRVQCHQAVVFEY